MKHKAILLIVAAAIVALAAAPAALAASSTVPSSVRVQGATSQVLSRTSVHESAAGGKITDSDGTSFVTTNATALGAAAAALRQGNVKWVMTVGSFGPFIDSIDGLSMAADFSNWWELVVNGYAAPVGAGSLQTVAGDSYLWFQNPDATASKPAFLLVNRVKGGTAQYGFVPGQTVTVKSVGENLADVHSQADAIRFSTTDIQTPAQFPAVSGVTLHVGSHVYNPAGSKVTISGLAPGTYAVWAEKAMDATNVYVRSETTLINVGAKPSLGTVTAWRANAKTVRVRLTLSQRCTLDVSVAKGAKRLAEFSGSRTAGARTLTLHLNAAAPLNTPVNVKVTAEDSWGRKVMQKVVIASGH